MYRHRCEDASGGPIGKLNVYLRIQTINPNINLKHYCFRSNKTSYITGSNEQNHIKLHERILVFFPQMYQSSEFILKLLNTELYDLFMVDKPT